MDVSAIASLSTSMSQAQTATEVQTTVFRKALDAEAQAAMQLIAVAAQAIPASSNPPNLGQQVDVFA